MQLAIGVTCAQILYIPRPCSIGIDDDYDMNDLSYTLTLLVIILAAIASKGTDAEVGVDRGR